MSIKTNYTEEEIDALVNEVRQAFLAPAFEAVQGNLAKSMSPKDMPGDGNGAVKKMDGMDAGVNKVPGPTAQAMMGKADDSEASPPGEPAGDEKEAPPSDGGSDSPPADQAPPADASASPATGDANTAPQDPSQGGMVTPEQLHQAYDQLSDEELKAHYEAMKAVIMARMQGQGASPDAAPPTDASASPAGPAPAGPSAAPAGPSASPAAPPPAGPSASPAGPAAPPMEEPPPAMKSEMSKFEKNDSKDREIVMLKKAVADVTDLLIKALSQPQVKAVTSVSQLNKSEKPASSRGQVEAQLLRKAEDQSLNKRDRELLTKFFMPNSKVSIEEVEYLLK